MHIKFSFRILSSALVTCLFALSGLAHTWSKDEIIALVQDGLSVPEGMSEQQFGAYLGNLDIAAIANSPVPASINSSRDDLYDRLVQYASSSPSLRGDVEIDRISLTKHFHDIVITINAVEFVYVPENHQKALILNQAFDSLSYLEAAVMSSVGNDAEAIQILAHLKSSYMRNAEITLTDPFSYWFKSEATSDEIDLTRRHIDNLTQLELPVLEQAIQSGDVDVIYQVIDAMFRSTFDTHRDMTIPENMSGVSGEYFSPGYNVVVEQFHRSLSHVEQEERRAYEKERVSQARLRAARIIGPAAYDFDEYLDRQIQQPYDIDEAVLSDTDIRQGGDEDSGLLAGDRKEEESHSSLTKMSNGISWFYVMAVASGGLLVFSIYLIYRCKDRTGAV